MSRMVFTISAVRAWQVRRLAWNMGSWGQWGLSHLVLAKDGLRGPGAGPEFTSHGDTEPTEQILKPTLPPYTIPILERGVGGAGEGRVSFFLLIVLQREWKFSLLSYHCSHN